MKKIFYFAAILIGLVSCSKENAGMEDTNTENPLLFTAEIVNSGDEAAEGVKTQIDIINNGTSKIGKVSWTFNETEQDIITVKDKNEVAAQYKVIALGEDGRATFAPLDDKQPILGDGPYTATYGDIENQIYNPEHLGSNCPMEAVSGEVVDGLINLSFRNTAAVVSIKVKSDGAVLKRVIAAGKVLNITPYVNITKETTFDVAIPAGEYESGVKIDFIALNGIVQSKTTKALALKANQMHQVKVTSGLDFKMEPLDGEFSISETEKVRFAPGNIVQDAEMNYSFEDKQFYFNTYPCKATYANSYDANGKHKETTSYGLFKWSKDGTELERLINTFPGWDLLTGSDSGEWYYLTIARTTDCTNRDELDNAKFSAITISDTYTSDDKTKTVKIAGYLLFPDSFTWPEDVDLPKPKYINYNPTPASGTDWNDRSEYTSTDFEKLENAGLVFLPAVGRYHPNDDKLQNSNFENDATGNFANTAATGYYMVSLKSADNKLYFKYTVCNLVFNEDGGSYGRAIRFVVRYEK